MNPAKTLYARLQAERPQAFEQPGPDGIEIMLAAEDVSAAERATASWFGNEAPDQWRETGVMYADPYFMLVKDAVRFPDRSFGVYSRLLTPIGRPDGIAVLPLLGEDLVLIKHFRHATRQFHWEIPRGYGEPGLSPEDTVRQELREELGAVASEVITFGRLYSDTGLVGGGINTFAARIGHVGVLEAREGIVAHKVLSSSQINKAIANGEINDGITLGLIARARASGILA